MSGTSDSPVGGPADRPADGTGCCRWVPLRNGSSLRVEIGPGRDAARLVGMADEIDAEWARLCAGNPRYFNGPILVVETMAEDAGTASGVIRARRGEFKHLAVRPAVETGVGQLGVTGVLEARDAAGEAFVLLGRRSAATRIFGGMWELGPSGGVDPPPASESAMDWQDVWRALVEEIREEVGLAVEPDPAPPVALVDDPLGHSVEVVFRVQIVRPVEELAADVESAAGTSRWEYDEVRWVGVGELGAFARAERVIPATVAVWRGLGWIGPEAGVE